MFITRSVKSLILILIQFICIIYIGLSGRLLPENIILRVVMAIAGVIAVWAILIMNKKFNVAPDVLMNAKLIRIGPYRFIRHPMYLSVFMITLCWLIDYFTYVRMSAAIILFVIMIFKIKYEEELLKKAFLEYEEYQSQTKKIIPYIY